MPSLLATLRSVLRPLRQLAGRFVLLPVGSAEAPFFFKAAHITSAEQVEGDFLEFGTYRGNSIIRAYYILRQVYEERYRDLENIHSPEYRARVKELWEKMRFFAFDSFEGLPGLHDSDGRMVQSDERRRMLLASLNLPEPSRDCASYRTQARWSPGTRPRAPAVATILPPSTSSQVDPIPGGGGIIVMRMA